MLIQARQERKAAYEVTSQEVTKWQPMVKVSGTHLLWIASTMMWAGLLHTFGAITQHDSTGTADVSAVVAGGKPDASVSQANREAPTLAFSKPRGGAAKATTTAALTAQLLPETDMEAEVAAMLQAAGVHSGKAVEEAEDALALKVGRLHKCHRAMTAL